MSVIKTDLLQNRLGTSHPAVTKADFVKAWGSVNQTGTQALGAQFNVSSVNDGGVGLTTFLLVSSFFDPSFSSTTGIQNQASNYDRTTVTHPSASQVAVAGFQATATLFDVVKINFISAGNLA